MEFNNTITKKELDITAAAGEKLYEIMCEQEDCNEKAIRIYIAGGGCGGITYGMTMADREKKADTDTVRYISMGGCTGIQVFVDAVALEYLHGAQIDYLKDIGRERFVFNNVFQQTGGTGGCNGCGGAQ